MIFVRRLALALTTVAFAALPAPAAGDGVMLIQAGAYWMGRDDGPREEAPLHRVYYPYNPGDGREGFAGDGEVVVRGASHDDPAESLSLTRRRSYDRRGASAGHHHVGFRCATSEDLGGR
ncbi:MAG: hypothetical protein HYU25_04170 [Candidatus Rokubacteria bacterium]|nr:hypothetical protein [Candidatus Rokubacteria bacterium]